MPLSQEYLNWSSQAHTKEQSRLEKLCGILQAVNEGARDPALILRATLLPQEELHELLLSLERQELIFLHRSDYTYRISEKGFLVLREFEEIRRQFMLFA